jgi:SAM-dependent methyltransferase
MSKNPLDAISHYTQQNRRAWNEIAGVREKIFPQADFFADGGSTLDGRVVEAARQVFGQVTGLRVLHLQCATGEDTLSWAVLGALAVGVDIADAQIELARQKAVSANLRAEFYAADIYDLPAELRRASFDVVFTGGGALVWLPDLSHWATVVAACLKPGGRLILLEEHPLASCLWVENGRLVLEEDYFARSRAYEGSGWQHFKGGEGAKENKYEFVWPLGDVVTALARAGLVIERLEEFPGGPEWRFGDQQAVMQRLPGEFLLIARK